MKYRLFFAALLTLTIGVSGVSRAQSTDTDIIAVVNGEAITDAHVMMFYKSLPQQYQQVPVETLRKQILASLIERYVGDQQPQLASHNSSNGVM